MNTSGPKTRNVLVRFGAASFSAPSPAVRCCDMTSRMSAFRSGETHSALRAPWTSSIRTACTLFVAATAALFGEGATGCGGGQYHPEPLPPAVCSGIDLQPASTALDERAIIDFLKAQGIQTRTEQKRGDLVYVEALDPQTNKWIRLRVAILGSSMLAGRELHDAMLQHKKGSWGIHRSNLAVLGPVSDVEAIRSFATKTKLACWGVLTIAASDEAVVVPGGYREL